MPDSRGGVCPRCASNRPAREHAIAFCCGARKNAVLFADSRIAAVIPACARMTTKTFESGCCSHDARECRTNKENLLSSTDASVSRAAATTSARPWIVAKFGGTSVSTRARWETIARIAAEHHARGRNVLIVVSALSGITDMLKAIVESRGDEARCREAQVGIVERHHSLHRDLGLPTRNALDGWLARLDQLIADPRRAQTALAWQAEVFALGELMSSTLGAAFLGAQGLATRWLDAREHLRAQPLANQNAWARYLSATVPAAPDAAFAQALAARGEVFITQGFIARNGSGKTVLLGRGGSDTSAVAIAAAIGAERCDIYTDVDGVYTTDPRVVPKAHRMDKIAYEEMLELASLGAKVMQVRSVELGMVHNVRIFVRSSFEKPEDIDSSKAPSGTLICDEGDIVEQQTVTGIAFSKDEAQISIRRVQDKPGVAAAIFGPLADASINVDMIVQNVSADGATTDLTFTVPSADYERARVTVEKAKGSIGYERMDGATDVAKVSVIGIGMRSHAGVAAQAFKALAEKKINILAITTSEIKFSVLIKASQTDLAVRTLHTLYGLDKG